MMDYYDPNEHWMHNPKMQEDIDPDDAMRSGCFVGLFYLVAFIVLLVVMSLLSSCTTTKVVTVERVRTDTVKQTKVQRDSVWLHDSTFVKVAGDTVWIERWHTVWQNHTAHDTVYKARVDSVPVPYPVVKEVERPMTRTEKGLMLTGIVSIIFIIIFIVSKVKRYLPLP